MPEKQAEKQKSKAANQRQFLSYMVTLASAFFWTTSYLYCNQNNVNPTQFLLIRGVMDVLISYSYCRYKKRSIDYRKVSESYLLLRNVILVFHGLYTAFCQFYLPLYVVHTIGATGTIFAILMDYFIDKKTLTKKQIIWITFAFIGIFMIAFRNQLNKIINGQSIKQETDFKNYKSKDPFVITAVSFGLLIVMLAWAYSIKMTQKMQLSAQQGNLSLGITLAFCSALLYCYIQQKSASQIIYKAFFYSALPCGLAQLFFVIGILLSEHVGITILIGDTCILFAYMYSVLRYSETLSFYAVCGSIITFIGLTKIILN